MNAVGIDVSKGKSMIAVMQPFGEVVVSPFEVRHTDSELSELAKLLKSLDGETRVVMEYGFEKQINKLGQAPGSNDTGSALSDFPYQQIHRTLSFAKRENPLHVFRQENAVL